MLRGVLTLVQDVTKRRVMVVTTPWRSNLSLFLNAIVKSSVCTNLVNHLTIIFSVPRESKYDMWYINDRFVRVKYYEESFVAACN
jgi:hypothetical protein